MTQILIFHVVLLWLLYHLTFRHFFRACSLLDRFVAIDKFGMKKYMFDENCSNKQRLAKRLNELNIRDEGSRKNRAGRKGVNGGVREGEERE